MIKQFAEQAAARLGLAIALAFALVVAPTVGHQLVTNGPIASLMSVAVLAQWIVSGLMPGSL